MGARQASRTWRIALIAWIAFIWVHSLLPGDTSSTESGFFLSLLRPVFELFGLRDLDTMHFVLRKCAHFSEYLVLGVLAVQAIGPRLRDAAGRLALFFAVWVGVPCIDETIQMFTPERGPAVADVLIDMSGFATGAALSAGALALLARRRAASEQGR